MGSKNPRGQEWAQVGLVVREETIADQALSVDVRV